MTLKAGSFVSFDCSGSPQSPGLLSQQAYTALIGALTDPHLLGQPPRPDPVLSLTLCSATGHNLSWQDGHCGVDRVWPLELLKASVAMWQITTQKHCLQAH
jgi:hypothetical protein